MLNTAVTIILEEHCSLRTVLDALEFLVRQVRHRKVEPDFEFIWAMIDYLNAFPEKLHHPKEDAHLFPMIRKRSCDADAALDLLQRQHEDGTRAAASLRLKLQCYEDDISGGIDEFAAAVETFARETRYHMDMEEETILNLARRHFSAEDWIEIARAFSEYGDSCFARGNNCEFGDLFARIVKLAPTPNINSDRPRQDPPGPHAHRASYS